MSTKSSIFYIKWYNDTNTFRIDKVFKWISFLCITTLLIILIWLFNWNISQVTWNGWNRHDSSSSSSKDSSCFFCLSFFFFFSLTSSPLSSASRFLVGFLKTIFPSGGCGFSSSSEKKDLLYPLEVKHILWPGYTFVTDGINVRTLYVQKLLELKNKTRNIRTSLPHTYSPNVSPRFSIIDKFLSRPQGMGGGEWSGQNIFTFYLFLKWLPFSSLFWMRSASSWVRSPFFNTTTTGASPKYIIILRVG